MSPGLCLAVAGHLVAALAGIDGFTLAWTHSVERVEWRERYAIADGTLRLEEARIRGSGAGMEPPSDARLIDGWWVYHPDLPALPAIHLAHSGHAGDYRLCTAAGCRPLHALAPQLTGEAGLTLAPCADPG